MASYTVTGRGSQTVGPNVTRLFVRVTALPPGFSNGEAEPTNYYKVAALSFGTNGYFRSPVYVTALQYYVDIEQNVDTIAYFVPDGGTIVISENNPSGT